VGGDARVLLVPRYLPSSWTETSRLILKLFSHFVIVLNFMVSRSDLFSSLISLRWDGFRLSLYAGTCKAL
jgi:hypothetical protein